MKRINKILIVIPNTRWFDKRYFHITAYTPCLLSAIIKNHVNHEILDANIDNLDFVQVKERIELYIPDLVAITCLTMEYAGAAHKLAEITKSINKDIITVIGGIYATLLPHLVMKDNNTDYAVLGEGETRFPEFLQILNSYGSFKNGFDGIAYRTNGEIKIIPKKKYIENLDTIPFPNYSKVDTSKYFNIVNKGSLTNFPKQFPYVDTITSRGCAFKCIFCSSQAINGPKIRYRSAENVLKEIDWLVAEYGVKHITFNDDNLYLDKPRIIKILNGLIERNYELSWKSTNAAVYALDDELLELIKKSGGYQIFLAIESGDEYVLKNIIHKPLKLSKVPPVVKKCKELGIQTSGIFMIGLPGETWDQIRQTFRYAESLELDCCMFNIATPLPCTKMYDIAKENGYLGDNVDFNFIKTFGFGKASITTEEFEPFELQVLRAFEWDRIVFATEEKRKVVAAMLGLTLDEVEKLRRETRRKLGIHHIFKDETVSAKI